MTSKEDARGTTDVYAYSARNWRVQADAGAGNLAVQQTTNTNYDLVGNVQSVIDPLGTVASFGYDANYRQTVRIDAFGVCGIAAGDHDGV